MCPAACAVGSAPAEVVAGKASVRGVYRRGGKQQTRIDRNTRQSHPWSDVLGGEGGVGMGVRWKNGGRWEGEESVDGVRWE